MKSVYVTKQAEFIVSTQNKLLTATGAACSFAYCDPFAKFFLIDFVICYCSMFDWLVGFKNHRGQNLRNFFLKFPVQSLRERGTVTAQLFLHWGGKGMPNFCSF